MKHNQGRSVESVTEAFYEGPVSQVSSLCCRPSAFHQQFASPKNGRRIFYFIISRVALIDYDLLAFYVFQILDGITDNFDLVIDLTGFSPATELPITWLRRSVQICPSGILPRMTVSQQTGTFPFLMLYQTLALYNPNSYARKRMRRITSELRVIGTSFIDNPKARLTAWQVPYSAPASLL